MKIREIVIYLYGVALLLSLLTIQNALVFGFYALVAVCGIMLAVWVHADGEQIEDLYSLLKYVHKRLSELEKSQNDMQREITGYGLLQKRVNELEKNQKA